MRRNIGSDLSSGKASIFGTRHLDHLASFRAKWGSETVAQGFSVYDYADGASNNSTNTGIYQISGTGITTSSVALTYNSNFSGTFTQATAGSPIGNYVVFTIPNVQNFTLLAIPSSASTSFKRAPVNGIQIVPR